MRFLIYDARGKLRFQSRNWPMARSALDLVIQEAQALKSIEMYPRLSIGPDLEREKVRIDQ